MRITLLMFYLYSGFTFGQSKPNTFFVPASKAPPADSLIDILVNIEELIWQDSTKVVFLAITHHDDKYELRFNLYPNKVYRNLGAPLIIGRPFEDNCLIYPLLTKGNTSYFLLDDFNNITDSVITLSITVSMGEWTQSNAIVFHEYVVLRMDEIQIKLNSLAAYSSGILANKDWYARWIGNNPAYNDQRTLNAQNQCK